MRTPVTFQLNGKETTLWTVPGQSLLDLLRENCHWEVKCGCAEGDCGACAVMLDNTPVKSCLVMAVCCQGCRVETIRGMAEAYQATAKLQQAFVDCGAVQCGFCTPGMLTAATAYILSGGKADRLAIREAIAGNLCRCTGYVKIVDAVYRVAVEWNGKENGHA